MKHDFDVIVIGAGVVGLAVAKELAENGHSVGLLEKNSRYGLETSSRNSEVIHCGMHYPPGSLKAACCVEGNRLLYETARAHNIAYSHIGKITVAAAPEEIPVLERLYEQGSRNGVPEMHLLDGKEVRKMEPTISAAAGLLTQTTGLINAHGLMDFLAAKFRRAGGLPGLGEKVTGLEKISGGYRIITPAARYTAAAVVNSAGLYSDKISALLGIPHTLSWAKGDYFTLQQKLAVSRLIYPAPLPNALGIHLTHKMGGGYRFGPDIEYVSKTEHPYPDEHGPGDFSVGQEKRHAFRENIHRYLPGIREENLEPEMFGIRAKLQGPNDGFRDFIIKDEADHGCPGFINLVGIESPGLTSCLSIAKLVLGIVKDH